MNTTESTVPSIRRLTATWRIIVGLSPIFILTSAFLLTSARLAPLELAGTPLTTILVACAVFTPLLSQVAAAPAFVALTAVDAADDAMRCAVVARVLPRLAPWALLPAFLLGALIGPWLGWATAATLALITDFALHVVMGIAMVAGFSTKRASLLLGAWLSYAIALFALPEAAWWLPPTAAAATEIALLLVIARGVKSPPTPPVWKLARGLTEGFGDGAPLWLIPITVWLLDPAEFRAEIVFAALIPALLGYQAFMVLIADSLWSRISWIYSEMTSSPYQQARRHFGSVGRSARRSTSVILVTTVLLAFAGIAVSSLLRAPSPTISVVLASCVGSGLFAVAYQYSIIGSRQLLNVTSLVLLINAIAAATLGWTPELFLWVHAGLSLIILFGSAPLTLSAWRRPEYTLFWRKAMAL